LLALQPQVARLIADPEKSAVPREVEIPADRVVGEWLQGEKILLMVKWLLADNGG